MIEARRRVGAGSVEYLGGHATPRRPEEVPMAKGQDKKKEAKKPKKDAKGKK